MEQAGGIASWFAAAVWALAGVVHAAEGDVVVAAAFVATAAATAVVLLADRPRVRSTARRAVNAALLFAVVGMAIGLVRDLA